MGKNIIVPPKIRILGLQFASSPIVEDIPRYTLAFDILGFKRFAIIPKKNVQQMITNKQINYKQMQSKNNSFRSLFPKQEPVSKESVFVSNLSVIQKSIGDQDHRLEGKSDYQQIVKSVNRQEGKQSNRSESKSLIMDYSSIKNNYYQPPENQTIENSNNQSFQSIDSNRFVSQTKTLQPPSLSRISSISNSSLRSSPEQKNSVSECPDFNVASLYDVVFQNEKSQFQGLHQSIEIELYRIAFLKRTIQELPEFVDHLPLLQVSLYYLQKARIIYGLQFLRKLKFNFCNVQTSQWNNFTQRSSNYRNIMTELPKILDNDQQDLRVLYLIAQQNISNLQKNPDFPDVIQHITKDIQSESLDSLYMPYRKIIWTLLTSLLNKLNDQGEKLQLYKMIFKILCCHLINRVFDQQSSQNHFSVILNKYGRVIIDPTYIENFISQSTQLELQNQIQELISTYFNN